MEHHSHLGNRLTSLVGARLETLGIHGGGGPEPITGAVVPPIFQSTTYAQPRVGSEQDFTYSRAHNPTVSALESALASLEGLAHARCFATGMAATSALALATLESGSHVVCSDVVYGGTVRLLEQVLDRFGVETTFVDTSDPALLAEALRPDTRLVFVETPANPTLKLTDLKAVGEVLADHPALLAVDNTFLTAALQRPAELGADIVVYSTTKYIEGHNSTVGGALVMDCPELCDRLDFVRKTTGSIQSPWEAWLTLRGLKTLPLRMERHSQSARLVARWLADHPSVDTVHYPFLDTFPQRLLAERQQRDGGGMLAFEVRGGLATSLEFMNSLRLCTLAENLGAAETLVTHPPTMTHGDLDPGQRRQRGISDSLVRLSVGLEHPDDLLADLDQALEAATAKVEAS
ncbi:MAG: PLP-dependent aspartate aminotransferase family protein [Deltaproteobacteria bacterium]|nr:PLP-dependent aspartate aminotransferase family protein [Deltaproteobacteria bacterium]